MQDGGVIPVTGFPRVDGMANEEERARNKRARCKHGHLIQPTFVLGRSSRGYTFEACIFGAVRVVEGSSGTRFVDELDGSITQVFGDGSGTRVEEELGVSTCRGTWRSTDVVVLVGPGLGVTRERLVRR